jgi:hypothetical protein
VEAHNKRDHELRVRILVECPGTYSFSSVLHNLSLPLLKSVLVSLFLTNHSHPSAEFGYAIQ